MGRKPATARPSPRNKGKRCGMTSRRMRSRPSGAEIAAAMRHWAALHDLEPPGDDEKKSAVRVQARDGAELEHDDQRPRTVAQPAYFPNFQRSSDGTVPGATGNSRRK